MDFWLSAIGQSPALSFCIRQLWMTLGQFESVFWYTAEHIFCALRCSRSLYFVSVNTH